MATDWAAAFFQMTRREKSSKQDTQGFISNLRDGRRDERGEEHGVNPPTSCLAGEGPSYYLDQLHLSHLMSSSRRCW